jgi:hypothetical protein
VESDDEHHAKGQGNAEADEHHARGQGNAEADDECDEDNAANTTPGTTGVQVVGYYVDSMTGKYNSYSWNGTTFTAIVVPGAIEAVVNGVNKAGHIVGEYWDAAGAHGFLLVGSTLTRLDFPAVGGVLSTEALGINGTDQIVGRYTDKSYNPHGFLWAAGTFTPLDYPGANGTTATGINDAGQIVGHYYTLTPYVERGWLRTGGTMSPVTIPGAVITKLNGINATGQMVGQYTDTVRTHGFKLVSGVATIIDIPNSAYTWVNGISDAGTIVGEYAASTAAQYQLAFKMP